MAPDTDSRLVRIEEKLDKLADVLVAMARAEEKIENLAGDHDKMYSRINKLSNKLDEIEATVNKNHSTIEFIHKLFWVALVAAAGSIAANIWM